MTEKLITVPFKTHAAQQILESLTEQANTVYYVFAGNHVPYDGGDSTIPTPDNSPGSLTANAYQNMLFGKQITNTDISLMIARNNWTANTVYEMYEHDTADLYDTEFFVVTDAGAYYHVYKCLNNAGGAESTVQPDFASASQEADLFDAADGYYETSDGYQWKYMYSIDQATFDKFSTATHIPYVANTSVANAAVAGSIDVIRVISGGSRYDNYFNGIFSAGDLRVTSTAPQLSGVSSEKMYSLGTNQATTNASGSAATVSGQANVTGTATAFTSDFQVGQYIKVANSTAYEQKRIASITNSTLLTVAGTFSNTFTGANVALTYIDLASSVNSYYTNCVIKIVSGTASGEYKNIVNYVNDGTKKIVVLESAFTVNPDTTSQYEVSPSVNVVGNGSETINVAARALINTSAANSVYKVEILTKGAGYILATANVNVSNALSVSNTANLKPIISPPGGHGFNGITELDASALGISVKFQNSESNVFSTANDFRQIGILKDPLFANVEINHTKLSDGSAGSDGTFISGETLYQYRPIALVGTVSISSVANTCNGTSTKFGDSLAVGNTILIQSGNSWFRATVSSITSNTRLAMSTNATFTNTAALIYSADLGANAKVSSVVGGGVIYAGNVSSGWVAGKKFIGATSHAVANVANVEINNVGKGAAFTSFNQLVAYSGTINGTFQADEYVYQTSLATANARFQSSNATHVLVTNQFGVINTNGTIVGNSSQAVLTITNKYNGDLVVGSGDTIYLQNGPAVSRSNTQTETIRLVIDL
jgi:hypothetical protein